MAEQLPSRMSVELSLAGAEPVEVYDRAIGNYDTIFRQAEAMALFAQLPPVLRGYLLALAADRLDECSILTFADWLEDHGQTAEGQRVRLLRPQPGGLIGLVPSSDAETEYNCLAVAAAEVERLTGCRVVVFSDSGQNLRAIDPEQLRAAGWVREEEAREWVRAEREACARAVERIGGKVDEGGVLAAYLAAHLRGRGE